MSPSKCRTTTAVSLLMFLVVSAAAAQATGATEFGSIRGRVVNDQGSPVSSANVTIADISLAAVSGPDGSFEFSSVPVGTHSL